jgi:thioredoxin-like negative regulator of GroEL
MKWYAGLEKFVEDYPNSPDSAEALFQLANAREMSGRESDAAKWYSQIVSKFPQTPQAVKSKGALYRLGSVGKQMQLKGITSNNKALDIAKFKDYNVVVYYWSALSSSAQTDVMALKAAKEKYGSKLQIIGVNLDNNPEQMTQFVEQNNIGWYQIDGKGMDGPLASEMGIIAPTMILVDASGKIVNRNVQARELDSALKLLFAPPTKLD